MVIPEQIKRYAEHVAKNGSEDTEHITQRLNDLRGAALMHLRRYKDEKKRFEENEKISVEVAEWLKSIDETKTENQ